MPKISKNAKIQNDKKIKDLRLKEQEELELAIALSLDEAEQSKVKTPQTSPTHAASNSNEKAQEEDDSPKLPVFAADEDSDLQKYLDRSYWEQRNKSAVEQPQQPTGYFQPEQASTNNSEMQRTTEIAPQAQAEVNE